MSRLTEGDIGPQVEAACEASVDGKLLEDRDQLLARVADLEAELKSEQALNGKLEDKAKALEEQAERWMVVAKTRESRCETCDGCGTMDVLVPVLPPDEGEKYEEVPCAECGGTGRGTVAALLQEERWKREEAERKLAAVERALRGSR